MMKILTELDKRTDFVNSIIKGYLPAHCEYNDELINAIEYSLMCGGKRLRPILIDSFYRLFGGLGEVVRPFMAAMEMLHTYSLVHDDLPAIDNDDLRRGMPTTHVKYGEAVGVLCGDALLHLAYETAMKAFDCDADGADVIRALRIFGDKTGLSGMLGGQSADVIATGKDISDDCMQYIYRLKTGALIEGSMMIGAALAKASESELSNVCKAGELIGIAFQIRDDILDIYGDESALGKPLNSDERNHKKTYLSVFGLERAQEIIDSYSREATDIIRSLDGDSAEEEFIIGLFEYLCYRDR